MKRIRIYLSISLFLVITVAVVTGFLTAASFQHDNSFGNYLDRTDLILNLDENKDLISPYFYNEIHSLEQLMNESPYIVKVKPNMERESYASAVRSAVQVLDVYKGGDHAEVRKGSRLYIYEPSYFFSSVYNSFGGYQIMKANEEYILFLKPLSIPKGYTYKGDEAITFVPVSTYYGKFRSSNRQRTPSRGILTQQKADEGYPYVKVKDWEIITTKPDILNTYRTIQTSVWSKFTS